MSLFQLPPELLLYVFSYLGPQFFSRDIGRLTVSRAWYDLAWAFLVRNLHLTARSLERFTKSKVALSRSHPYIITIKLSLSLGYYQYIPPSPARDLEQTSGNVDDTNALPAPLELSLARLAALLPKCLALQSLSIQCRGQSSIMHLDEQSSLNAAPLAKILSLKHLTTLKLDTAGCLLRSPLENKVHLCQCINSLFPSLRRLHCRMEEICEDLLQCPPSDTALEEVIIILSLSQLSSTTTSYRYYPDRCQTDTRDFPQLKLALHTQAANLAASLKNPRLVRVISHQLPSCDIYAFDAIARKYFRLGNNVRWGADGEFGGEVVESDESDESGESDENDVVEGDAPTTPQLVW